MCVAPSYVAYTHDFILDFDSMAIIMNGKRFILTLERRI